MTGAARVLLGVIVLTNSVSEFQPLINKFFAPVSELFVLTLHLVADVKEVEALLLPNGRD